MSNNRSRVCVFRLYYHKLYNWSEFLSIFCKILQIFCKIAHKYKCVLSDNKGNFMLWRHFRIHPRKRFISIWWHTTKILCSCIDNVCAQFVDTIVSFLIYCYLIALWFYYNFWWHKTKQGYFEIIKNKSIFFKSVELLFCIIIKWRTPLPL